MRRTPGRLLVGGALALLGMAALLVWLNVGAEWAEPSGEPTRPGGWDRAAQVSHGAYLVRAGGCVGCHTERGSLPFAGGRPIETPFGVVHSSNLTSDAATGLGRWSSDDFWRALHHGRSRNGRLLYPAFPYPNYTRVSRADADAMHAFLQTVPPVVKLQPGPQLGFPFGTPLALAVWRALYFRPGVHRDNPDRSPGWNRGAYLVGGLGHCNACHSARNALGATGGPLELRGGLIPVQKWYAPSLASPLEAGVGGWTEADVVRLLKDGRSDQGYVTGPMSEVVLESTQHLSDSDLASMAVYLRSIEVAPVAGSGVPAARAAASAISNLPATTPGGKLYAEHCAACHGDTGVGVAGAYPALAGNRAVTLPSLANLVHIVREGGFPPATAGNPRPYGMPPFANVLSDADLAELLGFIRTSWGNTAPPVYPIDVARVR